MTYDPKRGLFVDLNTPLIPMDRFKGKKNKTKQKINNKTQTLNDTLDKMDLLNILRTFLLNTFMYHPPLSILIFFMLKSILSDIRIATTDFLYLFISSYFQSVYVSWFEMDPL